MATPGTRTATVGVAGPALVSRALEVAGRLANDAAEVIIATAGRGAAPGTGSSPYDWVTDTGRTLERHTRRVLTAEFPGVPVLGEEYGGPDGLRLPWQPDGPELVWVVDPVDGTTNYVAGVPWCGYSLALLDPAGPLVGVIADPYQAQIYAAARGRGLRANGRPVVGPPTTAGIDGFPLVGGLIFTELSGGSGWPGLAALVDACGRSHTGLRIVGSSALAITQVALGRALAAVLPHSEVWDVAGAVALASEAGAVVLRLDGTPDPLPDGGMVVAVPAVAAAVLALLGQLG